MALQEWQFTIRSSLAQPPASVDESRHQRLEGFLLPQFADGVLGRKDTGKPDRSMWRKGFVPFHGNRPLTFLRIISMFCSKGPCFTSRYETQQRRPACSRRCRIFPTVGRFFDEKLIITSCDMR